MRIDIGFMVELDSIVESVLPPANGEDEIDRSTRRTRNLSRSRSFDIIQSRHDSSLAFDIDTLAASTILAELDVENHMNCLFEDSDNIMQKQLFPQSLPWHNLKAPLLRNLPRDIEDMKCIWYASDGGDGDLFRASVDAGPHGFGMFDMNGLRIDIKGSANDTLAAPYPAFNPADQDFTNVRTIPSPVKRRRVSASDSLPNGSPSPSKRHHAISSDYTVDNPGDHKAPFSQKNDVYGASARRSVDPGVIELAVTLPLPSLELALLNYQYSGFIPRISSMQHDACTLTKAANLLAAERAEFCSSMPLYWHDIDKHNYQTPPAFFDLSILESELNTDDYGRMAKKMFHKNMSRRDDRKRLFEELSTKCIRKWEISVKVLSVSSRSSIYSDSAPYPLYCMASFPAYIQSGQTLTVESAIAKDEDGSREFLGSYDCRSTSTNPLMSFEGMIDQYNSKESSLNSSNRSRRINVGRTRQIWTGFHRISSTKVAYSSLVSGQKLDSSSYKRPKDARVLIRLNGKILSSDKPIRDQIGDPKWGKDRIRAALSSVYSCSCIEKSDIIISKDFSPKSYAYCIFNRDNYLKKIIENILRKSGSSKSKKRPVKQGALTDCDSIQSSYVSLKPSASEALKYKGPIFKCFPSEESFLRVICIENGVMSGVNINEYLNDAAKLSTKGRLCTICWTGSDPDEVVECTTCGLLVHEGCTVSQGQRFKFDNDPNDSWKCLSCASKGLQTPKIEERKSQRVFKLPDRFKDISDVNSPGLPHFKRAQSTSNICYFCPHSGGSMHMVGSQISPNQSWAHDVCRIWGSEKIIDVKGGGLQCCLCGTGTRLCYDNTTTAKSDGMFQTCEPNVIYQNTGLTRCAAVGCQVVFHPTCALLVTRLRATKHNLNISGDFKEEKKKDIELCQEYTLSLTQIRRVENVRSAINRTVQEKSYIIPVAFCGFHNPSREDSFYGCPPCADGISDFMRIPYQQYGSR